MIFIHPSDGCGVRRCAGCFVLFSAPACPISLGANTAAADTAGPAADHRVTRHLAVAPRSPAAAVTAGDRTEAEATARARRETGPFHAAPPRRRCGTIAQPSRRHS